MLGVLRNYLSPTGARSAELGVPEPADQPVSEPDSTTVLPHLAYAIDGSPIELPARVTGDFFDRTSNALPDRLHPRCLVFDEGHECATIVVVDSLPLPRDLLDQIKSIIQLQTGLRPDHVLISATHTHSAPATMNAFGPPADEACLRLFVERIPPGVLEALNNLAPVPIAWTAIQDSDRTHTRRWIPRPNRIDLDAFGGRTLRANMHPGYVTAPSSQSASI